MLNASEFSVSFVLITLILLHLTLQNVELTNPQLKISDFTLTQNLTPNHSLLNTPQPVVDVSEPGEMFSNCTVKKNGFEYDLSRLAKKKFWFYTESVENDLDLIFLLSVCHPIESVATCRNNSGACFALVNNSIIDHNGHKLKTGKDLSDISFITAGKPPAVEPKVLKEGFLNYIYDFGEICNEGYKQTLYNVELHLQCPRSSFQESSGPLLMVTSHCKYIFLWITKAACPKRIVSTSDPCIKKFSNSEYPLNLHSLHSDTFYQAYGINSSFEINICGPVQNGSCPDNTAICDTSDPSNPKILATSEKINFYWEKDALILSYNNTKPEVNSLSANIYLYCDRRAFTPRLFFLSKNVSNVYNFSIYTINVCNPEPSDCVFEDKKLNIYDLRPLYKKEGNWEVGTKSGNSTYHYLLNVCGPINPDKNVICPPGPVGACQSSESTTGSKNIGYITSDPSVNKDGSISIMYTGGHPCRDGVLSSSTRISFVCSNVNYPPVFVSVTPSCEHLFVWHNPAACPVNVVSSSDCRVSDPLFGHNFDLNPLRNASADYQLGSGGGGDSFRINVCGPLVTRCGDDEKAAVCQGGPGEEKSGGEAPAELLFNDGTMVMKFSNGTPGCGDSRWASQVLLLCSHDEKGAEGLQYIYAEEGACVHHFLWHTPRACPPIADVECSVTDGDVTYDLTALSNPDLNEVYINRERTRKYIINVCRSVVHSKESRCAYDAGACLIDLSHENKTLSLGRVGSGPFVERGQLKLRYEGGDACNATHTHSTVIEFECARDQFLSYPVLTVEESCSTFLKWRTVFACPRRESEDSGASTANGCTAVNPLTNYVFDMNTLKTEKPYELLVRDGVSLLITACGAVKDPRCTEEDAGACLVRTGAEGSSSAGRANQALNFRMWSTYLSYEGGEQCSNGFQRSTQVSFICREDSEMVGPVLIAEDAEACTFFVHWYTEEACERHIHCFAQSWEDTFDLSPLIRERDNYRVKDPENPDSLYLLNVCRPLNPVIGVNCHPGSSSCLVRKNQEPLGLGHPILNPTVVTTDETEDQVHLMYSYGSDCPSNSNYSLSSRIIFICNRSAGAGAPRFLRKANECQIQFEWETSVVCPPSREEEGDQVDCVIGYEAAKTNVDLSQLRRDQPYNVSFGDTSFLLNVCGGTACEDGVAVCSADGQSYGRTTKSHLRWDQGHLLVLTFYDDSHCDGAISGSRSARIFFECDLNAGFGAPRADPAMDDLRCTAVFNWYTNITCLEALYPTPAPPPPPASIPHNDSQLTPEQHAGIDMDGDDSSKHTWVSALIAGLVLTLVMAASVYVVGRSAFGRRLYVRAKRALARKGDQTFILDDQLL